MICPHCFKIVKKESYSQKNALRRNDILNLFKVNIDESLTSKQVNKFFNMSHQTIKKDLEFLELKKQLIKIKNDNKTFYKLNINMYGE